ncbi:MAG: hypothetical protein ACRET4_14880 [Steroidobacteraceae bacterium]
MTLTHVTFATVLLAFRALAGTDDVPPAEQPVQPAATEVAAVPAAQPGNVTLLKGVLVALRLLEDVGSDTQASGAQFKLEVTDDVKVDAVIVIPAGSIAIGEVIHAAKSSRLGKAGELSVTSRYVTVGDRQIKLRALLAGSGQNRTEVALFLWPFIKGKQIIIPHGTELVAKIANDESFTAPPSSP